MTATLSFERIRLYGYHGIHKEEQKTGNWFFIDIRAELSTGFDNRSVSLRNTIDYEALYRVLRSEFDRRQNLIEELTFHILSKLKSEFPMASKWTVSVEKADPLGVGSFHPRFTLSE